MARVRVHQHVNPLAKYYRDLPVKPLVLERLFDNPKQPLHLDIGVGRGRFLLGMSKLKKDWNFLGLEIREPLVKEANQIRDDLNLNNLHYEFCNAFIALGILLENVPREILQMVTIQFPDPWFKQKHAKRRMVKETMVEEIGNNLSKDGEVFVQTDIEFLAKEMFRLFEQTGKFIHFDTEESILPIKSEREKSVENRNLSVYRKIYRLKQ